MLACETPAARLSLCKIAAAYRAPRRSSPQPLRSPRDEVYSALQFLLQVGDVHLVRDAR
jgi:hypothetical protein